MSNLNFNYFGKKDFRNQGHRGLPEEALTFRNARLARS
jgi:hypothetical protein